MSYNYNFDSDSEDSLCDFLVKDGSSDADDEVPGYQFPTTKALPEKLEDETDREYRIRTRKRGLHEEETDTIFRKIQKEISITSSEEEVFYNSSSTGSANNEEDVKKETKGLEILSEASLLALDSYHKSFPRTVI